MSNSTRKVATPPKTFKEKLKWLGPGFLWMVSAAGSGELLFTPRIGSLYGYTLLWALLIAVLLKWFINREIGRYTVCTGQTVMQGFSEVSGKSNWALYLIVIPQLFVAVTTIAGLAGSAATSLVLVLPGNIKLWTIISIALATALVVWGRFKAVEKVSMVLAIILGIAAIIAASMVFPEAGKFAKGFTPTLPENVKFDEVLPWLGFMLSGAAGLIWYSYWIKEKGYGLKSDEESVDVKKLSSNEVSSLKGWLRQMTADSTVAVVGTLLITISFLILGTELLKPKGLVPEEDKVAETLGKILEHLWGPVGFWFMVTAVFVGFWDTVLSDQDGFGRMFSQSTRLFFKKTKSKWLDEKRLTRIFVIGLLTVIPIIVYLIMGEPVGLLKIAGAIEAGHIPIVVALVLYLNSKSLPGELKPSRLTFVITSLAGVFFAVFAVIYVLQLMK